MALMRIGILSSLAMIAIWWASAALAAEPIRIGVSLGLTGQYEQPALMHQRAYLLCQDQINARGGIFQRKVAFDIRDDQGSAEEARAIYLAFTAEDGVDMVLAPYSSDLTAAVAPIIEANRRDKALAVFLAPHADASLRLLSEAGLAGFRTPESCADAIRAWRDWTPPVEMPAADAGKIGAAGQSRKKAGAIEGGENEPRACLNAFGKTLRSCFHALACADEPRSAAARR